MDLIDRLRELAAQIPKQLAHIHTEEATKTALVMPFIRALGYDVFDPQSVVPEFTADVGTKKGEKVDYAILRDEKPIILIECKAAHSDLDEVHASQLYRYFSVTEARFGVLTNGVDYKFFSDLEEPNKMDSRPFLEFRLTEVSEATAAELKHFAPETFDLDRILSTASELKYTKGIMRALGEEWVNPSEDFVRLFAGRVYSGRMTQAAREQFTEITRKALRGFVDARVDGRLKSALQREAGAEPGEEIGDEQGEVEELAENGVVTTEEEIEGYYTVKAILSDTVDPARVFMRDRKLYCGIILDDNARKPICRMWFNTRQKHLGLFDAKKKETKVELDEVNGIYAHADALRETVRRYDGHVQEGDQSAAGRATS